MEIRASGAKRASGGAIGFLLCAFALVGLVGVFATYAAPLPLLRGQQREAAFDALMQAAAGPNSALEALRPALGEDADAAIAAAGKPELFVVRAAMRQRFEEEADAVADRQRLIIAVVTVSSALFGAMLIGFARPA